MLFPNYDKEIFSAELIEKIWLNDNPNLILEDCFFEILRKSTGKIDIDNTYIKTIVEYNINNLIYLEELFETNSCLNETKIREIKEKIKEKEAQLQAAKELVKPGKEGDKKQGNATIGKSSQGVNKNVKSMESNATNILVDVKDYKLLTKNHLISDLMNLLFKLIQLSDERFHKDNSLAESMTIENQMSNRDIQSLSNNLRVSEDESKKQDTHTNRSSANNELFSSVDIPGMTKNKLYFLKSGFSYLLNKFNGEEGVELKLTHTSSILKFLQSSFFPFLKLYYFFCNVEREVELTKLEFIINKPMEVFNLNQAIYFVDDKEEKIRVEKEEQALQQRIKNEEEEKERKKREEERLITEERNQHLSKELQEKNKEKNYKDLLNELSLNEEAKILISNAIDSMHKEIQTKVIDRQKKLDDRIKEVEDLIKGKKK